MNCAEEIGGRKSGLLDAPDQAFAVDEIVRSRRLGCGEARNLRKIRALTGGGLGLREGKRKNAEKECAGA